MLLRKPIGQDQELPDLEDLEEAFSIGESADIAYDYYQDYPLRQSEDWDDLT